LSAAAIIGSAATVATIRVGGTDSSGTSSAIIEPIQHVGRAKSRRVALYDVIGTCAMIGIDTEAVLIAVSNITDNSGGGNLIQLDSCS